MHDIYKREVELARKEQKLKNYDNELSLNTKKIKEKQIENDNLINELNNLKNDNNNKEVYFENKLNRYVEENKKLKDSLDKLNEDNYYYNNENINNKYIFETENLNRQL